LRRHLNVKKTDEHGSWYVNSPDKEPIEPFQRKSLAIFLTFISEPWKRLGFYNPAHAENYVKTQRIGLSDVGCAMSSS